MSNDRSCPRGEQHIDGQCLPTPSIVFQRCMDAFRTSSIEHDRGRELAVSASLKDRGGELQHERRDQERREYEGLATDDLSAAIGECRRQEEAERAGQIARAWDEAQQARTDAERARLEAVTARNELRRATSQIEQLEQASAKASERAERANAAAAFAELPTVLPDPAATSDAPPASEPLPDVELAPVDAGSL